MAQVFALNLDVIARIIKVSLLLFLIGLEAQSSLNCGQVFSNLPLHRFILGNGAGGSVFLVTGDFTEYVEKKYKSKEAFVNDMNALNFLRNEQDQGRLSDWFHLIEQHDKTPDLNYQTAYFKYYSGKTVFELSAEQNGDFYKRRYNELLDQFDRQLEASPRLKRKSEFPLYGARAIHYDFVDFQIVIHAKNILVHGNQFILIDPH